jgi:hydroxymethylpyrimidine/phosphomethylpyrimidine kinase
MENAVLVIGGLDPSAGAGILADCKAVRAAGAYAMGVCTAVTYQTEDSFCGIDWLADSQIIRQISCLTGRYKIAAAKIGLVQNLQTARAVLECLPSGLPIVWDPVLSATAGYSFHGSEQAASFISILNRVSIITPNIPEANAIFGCADASEIARYRQTRFAARVLLKGGHAAGACSDDYFISGSGIAALSTERLSCQPVHGSGCAMASYIAAGLALGAEEEASCLAAKNYVKLMLQNRHGNLALV